MILDFFKTLINALKFWVNEKFTLFDKKIENKIDKAEGKGLSSNDYTDEEKEKLTNIEGLPESSPSYAQLVTNKDGKWTTTDQLAYTDEHLIEWNGELGDRPAISPIPTAYFVHVSDEVPAMEEVVGGTIAVYYTNSDLQEFAIKESSIAVEEQTGHFQISTYAIVVPHDDFTSDLSGMKTTYPKAGVYFSKMGRASFTSMMRWSNVKTIDKDLLPAGTVIEGKNMGATNAYQQFVTDGDGVVQMVDRLAYEGISTEELLSVDNFWDVMRENTTPEGEDPDGATYIPARTYVRFPEMSVIENFDDGAEYYAYINDTKLGTTIKENGYLGIDFSGIYDGSSYSSIGYSSYYGEMVLSATWESGDPEFPVENVTFKIVRVGETVVPIPDQFIPSTIARVDQIPTDYAKASDLAAVATSGSWDDLKDKPFKESLAEGYNEQHIFSFVNEYGNLVSVGSYSLSYSDIYYNIAAVLYKVEFVIDKIGDEEQVQPERFIGYGVGGSMEPDLTAELYSNNDPSRHFTFEINHIPMTRTDVNGPTRSLFGDVNSITATFIISRVTGEFLDPQFLPKAESVADAAGDTPTAAEFNALLAALRNAGYMN